MKDYNNAVMALASGIESTQRKLDRDEKVSIAEELLKHGPENHSNWNNLELNLSQESIGNLQEYHGNLQQAYSEEIGKEIKQTMEKVDKATDLRERLHSELNTALDETKELEEIAKRLQDRGIGNVAGKEERQVRELGKNLEKLDSKGEDLEKLENRLESLLNSHNLDRENLHEELGRRAEAVEKILDSAGSTGGDGQENLDQIANRIIQKESKLQEAESRGLQQLEDDIKTLSSIVELEEQEISALRKVEKYLQNGNFSQASSTLDSLIQRRESFGDQSRAVQQIKQDLQEEKKIIIALQEFFNSIKQLEKKGISRDRLYQKMESQGSFSSAQEARDFFTGLESEFEGIEEDIARVKKLEQKERKLENLEHEKLKEIDDEDAQLRQSATGQQRRDLKEVHEKLKKLGFNLENEIDDDSGNSNSGSSSSDRSGPYGGKYGRPSSSEPWIISMSDVESNYGYMKEALALLEKHGWDSIAKDTGSALEWTGGDKYRFILNGDLLDRGDQPEKVWNSLFNLVKTSNFDHQVEMTMGNHDVALLVPGSAVALTDRPHSTCVGEGLEKFYSLGQIEFMLPGKELNTDLSNLSSDEVEQLRREHYKAYDNLDFSEKYKVHNNYKPRRKEEFANLIQNGNVKMIAEGYEYYYVHGGSVNNPGASKGGETYQEYFNRMLIEKVAEPILDDIANGTRANEMQIRRDIHSENGSFGPMFGAGRSDGGLIWRNWENIPESAGKQVTGHTGGDYPRTMNNGQLINENTHTSGGGGNPSIVIETPEGVFALSSEEDKPIDLVGY